jgi:uridylate kinase
MKPTDTPRILLKLSGEQFAGGREYGIDPQFVARLAKELAETIAATGVQLAIIVGGGNIMRGATVAKSGIERANGDYMGMLATIINGIALVDILEQNGVPARLQTRLRVDSVAEPYIRRRAIRHLEKGRVVVVAGGTGNPYVTTDTAAVTTALEPSAIWSSRPPKSTASTTKTPPSTPTPKARQSHLRQSPHRPPHERHGQRRHLARHGQPVTHRRLRPAHPRQHPPRHRRRTRRHDPVE